MPEAINFIDGRRQKQNTILGICFVFTVIHIIPLFYSETNALGPEK
jgi:hypothetical protein